MVWEKSALFAGIFCLLAGLISYVVLVMGGGDAQANRGSLFFVCFGWCMASLFFFNLPGLIHRLKGRKHHDE